MSVSLCDLAVTTALTGATTSVKDGFGDVTALTVTAQFTRIGGGATVDVWVQTSIDQGVTWIDIANFHWTTASAAQAVNVSGLVSITAPVAITDGALAANTVREGILGDRYRTKITSTGTYDAGSRVAVNVSPR